LGGVVVVGALVGLSPVSGPAGVSGFAASSLTPIESVTCSVTDRPYSSVAVNVYTCSPRSGWQRCFSVSNTPGHGTIDADFSVEYTPGPMTVTDTASSTDHVKRGA
jgi:hypothetical protein